MSSRSICSAGEAEKCGEVEKSRPMRLAAAAVVVMMMMVVVVVVAVVVVVVAAAMVVVAEAMIEAVTAAQANNTQILRGRQRPQPLVVTAEEHWYRRQVHMVNYVEKGPAGSMIQSSANNPHGSI